MSANSHPKIVEGFEVISEPNAHLFVQKIILTPYGKSLLWTSSSGIRSASDPDPISEYSSERRKSPLFAALDVGRYACAGGIIASAVANITFAPALPVNALWATVGACLAVWAARRWQFP